MLQAQGAHGRLCRLQAATVIGRRLEGEAESGILALSYHGTKRRHYALEQSGGNRGR